MVAKSRYRRFHYVVNNYPENIYEILDAVDCTYIIGAKEVGKKKGTPHIQGYIEFKDGKTISAAQKTIPGSAFKVAGGSAEQNLVYCTKENELLIEKGTPKRQGSRTDLALIRDMVSEKASDRDIIMEVTSLQAVKCIDTIRFKMIEYRPKDVKPTVTWIWGETGVGKSRKIKDLLDDDYDDCDYKNGFLIGYTGNPNVVFDDYRGQIPLHLLLKMLDFGRCTVNVKGTSCPFGATNIFFTSCSPPDEIYQNVKHENIMQLTRRIDVIENCTKVNCTEVGGNIGPDFFCAENPPLVNSRSSDL